MSPEAVADPAELRTKLAELHGNGQSIGLVPTMGALHEGHGALMERARAQNDVVVVSIFVNPLQFGPDEEFARYPRTPAEDLFFCEMRGVDLVFSPDDDSMRPDEADWVKVGPEAETLCGASRPGHFRGVATVVARLFGIVEPDRAYFGEKDFQQLVVVRKMAGELGLPVQIVPVETCREADGLAVSSRNSYLDPEERRAAAAIYRSLRVVRQRIADGDLKSSVVRRAGKKVMELEPLLDVEYLEIVDPETMHPVDRISETVRAVAAVVVGKTRLIDNVACEPGKKSRRRRSREQAS